MGRLLESAEGQRNTASYDSAEFFSRRLRENERTLVTLTLRIEEAFPNEVEVISGQSFRIAPYFIMHTVLCEKNTIAQTIDYLWDYSLCFQEVEFFLSLYSNLQKIIPYFNLTEIP